MTSISTEAPSSSAPRARTRRGLPPEIAATILALSAVVFGALTGMPAFGIFFGWAAASLTFGIPRARRMVLARCLLVGALFSAATLVAQDALTPVIEGRMPEWMLTVGVLAIANPLLIALGRIPALGSVPGMFIGFSTVLAVHLGGLAPVQNDIAMSLLTAIITTSIGVTFVWLYGQLTGARATTGKE